ncbi:MAG: ComF family protein [Candidatus Omnitrophota bacterium]
MSLIHNFFHGLIDLIYPKTCLACGKKITNASVNGFVCIECWGEIKINRPPFCHICGRSLAGKNICTNCLEKTFSFDRAFSCCLYEGVLKNLIRAFKYKNKDYLGAVLAKPMIEFVKEYNLSMNSIDAIVAVPLSKTKLREREYNHAFILGSYLAKEFNKNILNNALLRHKNTLSQTKFRNEKRFLNIKGAFSIKNNAQIKGKNILLVDDVLTTGATCSEASKVLKTAGANKVYVLTLAN